MISTLILLETFSLSNEEVEDGGKTTIFPKNPFLVSLLRLEIFIATDPKTHLASIGPQSLVIRICGTFLFEKHN